MSLAGIASGAAMIAINEAIFVSAQASLKTNLEAFLPDPGTPHDSTSDAIALTLYREQFVELANVIQLYHDLLTRDIDIIQKAHDNITDTDNALSAATNR